MQQSGSTAQENKSEHPQLGKTSCLFTVISSLSMVNYMQSKVSFAVKYAVNINWEEKDYGFRMLQSALCLQYFH